MANAFIWILFFVLRFHRIKEENDKEEIYRKVVILWSGAERSKELLKIGIWVGLGLAQRLGAVEGIHMGYFRELMSRLDRLETRDYRKRKESKESPYAHCPQVI